MNNADTFDFDWNDEKDRFTTSTKPKVEEEVIYQPTKRGRKKLTKVKVGKYFELTDEVVQTLQMLANHYHLNMTSALSKIILSHQKIIDDNQRTHEIEKTKITNYEKNIESLIRQMAAMEEELQMLNRSFGKIDSIDISDRLDRVEKQNQSLDATQQQLIKDLQTDGGQSVSVMGKSEILPTMNSKWVRDKQTRRVIRKESD